MSFLKSPVQANMMPHTCNHSTWEAETRESPVQRQPGLHRDSLIPPPPSSCLTSTHCLFWSLICFSFFTVYFFSLLLFCIFPFETESHYIAPLASKLTRTKGALRHTQICLLPKAKIFYCQHPSLLSVICWVALAIFLCD